MKFTIGFLIIAFALSALHADAGWVQLHRADVYNEYYTKPNVHFDTVWDAFNTCHNVSTIRFMYDWKPEYNYACPRYTIFMGGTCSGFAIMFMYYLYMDLGKLSTFVIVSNVRPIDPSRFSHYDAVNGVYNLHAMIEYDGKWWDVVKGKVNYPAWWYANYGYVEFRRYSYDYIATLSSKRMDGVWMYQSR